MYSPTLGRWLNPDPLTRDPTILHDNNEFGDWLTAMKNQYGYCGNSPINRADPSGLQFMLCAAPKKPCWDNCPTHWDSADGLWQYGCYCGKEPTPSRKKIDPPVDAVDTCCQKHDKCYGPPAVKTKAQCDKDLCKCVLKAFGDGKATNPCQRKAVQDIQFFYGPC